MSGPRWAVSLTVVQLRAALAASEAGASYLSGELSSELRAVRQALREVLVAADVCCRDCGGERLPDDDWEWDGGRCYGCAVKAAESGPARRRRRWALMDDRGAAWCSFDCSPFGVEATWCRLGTAVAPGRCDRCGGEFPLSLRDVCRAELER